MTVRDDNFAEYFTLAQEEALTARESRIADLRYGFASGEPHTLEQVGQELGISRERIRQILSISPSKRMLYHCSSICSMGQESRLVIIFLSSSREIEKK